MESDSIKVMMESEASVDLDDYISSSGESQDNDEKSLDMGATNDLTAKLAASGPVGLAAAAAISSGRRRFSHTFETNPAVRKRLQNRLVRKLQKTIDEFAGRVGQQAIVLIAMPGKLNNNFRVFGTKPLDQVIKNLQDMIQGELETALESHAPPPPVENPTLYELPPLIMDGIPTAVEKMTQAQLRAFIPLMLKYATGRGKPGWGRDSTKPPWWPEDVPWANIRMDVRGEMEKQNVSWTQALRKIVLNCYKYFGREDLLPDYKESTEQVEVTEVNATDETPPPYVIHTLVNNNDGTVSVVQVDQNASMITLSDGTVAHIQEITTLQSIQENGINAQVIQKVEECPSADVGVNAYMEVNSEGQILITGEDGQMGNLITIPVSSEVYQSMLANAQLQTGADGKFIVTRLDSNFPQNIELQTIDDQVANTVIQSTDSISPQVVQISIKDENIISRIKAENM